MNQSVYHNWLTKVPLWTLVSKYVEYVHDKELTVAEVEAEILTALSRASSEEHKATSQANDVTDQVELEPPKKEKEKFGSNTG